jgi:hypothetical protein
METEGAPMEAYQWFLFGMMVSWTLCLVVLAVMLRKANPPEMHTEDAAGLQDRCLYRYDGTGAQDHVSRDWPRRLSSNGAYRKRRDSRRSGLQVQ